MTTPLLISGRPLAVVNEDGSPIAGGGGGGGAPGYADGTIPSPAYAPLVAYRNDATGVIHIVTDVDPLPVTGGGGGGGGLTDVQLRATPVPVSGPLTDTQLRAADVPVALNAATLAALETIQIGSLPAVALDVATLAALETISVANLPAALVGGRLDVNLGASGITLPVSGPLTDAQLRASAVPTSLAALPGVAGTVAHDGVDSGSPVKIGSRARTADVAAVAQDDRVDSIASITGKQIYLPYCLPAATAQGTGNKTDTTDLALIAAAGAGIRIYITSITITNAHATVSTKVVLKSNSTIIWRGYAAALGGGLTVPLPTPLRCGANEALNAACVTTGADVDFSVVGFTAAE